MGKRGTLNRLSRHHVAEVMAASPSISAAARALNVRQSTVSRWVSSRKVAPPGRPRLAAVTPAALAARLEDGGEPLAPAAWAAALRHRYVFSIAEAQLLKLAESALTMALDEARDDGTRLSASRQFARLLQQLAIPEDDHGETQDTILPGA
jgi:hypothetical protein